MHVEAPKVFFLHQWKPVEKSPYDHYSVHVTYNSGKKKLNDWK